MKRGDPLALRREARGARMAAPPLAPRVVSAGPGMIITERVTGRPRALGRLDAGRAMAAGRVLRAVHGRRATATGALPAWRARAATLPAYARGRGRDAAARATTPGEHELVARATDAAVRAARAAPRTGRPFALLHGDLVQDNLVWPADGGDPVLVDWEFWRMGDPAEDLAYLVAVNDLPAGVAENVYRGYGAEEPLMARARGWSPLVLADSGLWLRAHGDTRQGAALLDRARHALDA